ncbi:MAG: hypothetical protein AAF577_16140 [Pseudomonadota bacterium]
MTALRLAMLFMVFALASCEGIKGASEFSKRKAFEAKYQPIDLVETNKNPNRVLTVFVYADAPSGGDGPREGYAVQATAGRAGAR